jgi:uncharacterized protein (DUF362 family)
MTRKTKTRTKRSRRRIILFGLLAVIVLAVVVSALIPDPPRPVVSMESVPVTVTEIQEATSDVALVQSAKADVDDLTEKDVRSMVREAVTLSGGLEDIIEDGDTVVLKPNFMAVTDMSNEGMFGNIVGMVTNEPHREDLLLSPIANGVTTDYRVAKAVSELVRELNPSGKIYIMEASGGGYTAEKAEILGYTLENIPEMDAFISMDETGAGYVDGDTSDLVAVDIGEYRLYQDDEGLAHTNGLYFFDKVYYEADVIISMPVLKNHMMAAVTGAIKNVAIGANPPSIYGNGGPDRNAIDHPNWDQLQAFIHDHYLARPVDFVVTDGLQGLQNGPLAMGAESTESVQMNLRVILAGKDALAVDTVQALITGVDPQNVDYFKALAANNIGIMDTARITVVGNVGVDQVAQAFTWPGFPYNRIYAEPSQSVYTDFEAPQVTIQNLELQDGTLTADLSSNKDLVKLEVFADGELVEVVQVNGSDIELHVTNDQLSPDAIIAVFAYDQYLNCAETTDMQVAAQ